MAEIACNDVIFSDIKAIFFDKDGTLEDSRLFLQELAQERVNQIAISMPQIADSLLIALGVTDNGLDPKGLMAVGSREENELAAAAYIASSGCGWFAAKELAHRAFDKVANKVMPNRKSSPMFPGSLEVLKSLAATNLKLGIISADSTVGIKTFVEREQINSYFQLLLGSDRILSKPSPLLYLKACQMLNVQPYNTLMVGDSLGDILMAQQANARGTIGISWDNPTAKHLDSATVIIDNLDVIKVF
ncbi:Haloacid dehalogenase superfamily enzyme, subfamily IA [Hyella patelloides LEGE 07179]|uniref:Haloacid dehalogenase superfamily enzyme, subfamily IA n=1 Tax=Hyella patelloides LEGE 07179 TaxID=945734 RepID=A0A563VQU8_9CYAN|nr:HAD family hydrolase [Hyella patelloides]VEP13781.1 Haloacid dehalogenase superfamily enzyme, subfamily IA [Hyella patelloides LEGE 07179]